MTLRLPVCSIAPAAQSQPHSNDARGKSQP